MSVLSKAGFTVTWQRDIYDAFEHIDQHKPEAIILDLLLPWSNGIQLLHELASYSDLQSIPVILYSNALPKDLRLEQLKHYGIVALLNKAVSGPGQLVETMQGVLRAKLTD